ncbi:DUF6338 family protein [Solwaraspora sp. WMMD1047]|uniref:DUF6338 family protein n=1 Tax=Solwaraspora sp. WMMD1047 TaxID=3016102 RepID=UPI002418044E|nr:DUF6338 family protein [Solwaraspora sp. WMMD1047]MDG4831559.1 DUF6338 family protein [Solwaraspora sp. WMMD1047]
MIPSTPLGVALLLMLIAPGLAYVLRRERAVPTGPRTAFREAFQVIFVSVASLTTVGLLATLLRAIAPDRTLNVRGLIQAPGPFARDHHVQLAWWSFGLLAAATVLAWVMADPRIGRLARRLGGRRPIRWLTGAGNEDITEVSAWWRVFEELKPVGTGITTVGVLLDDGSYVQGSLVSSTAGGLDYDKRELVLTAPLVYVTSDGGHHVLPAQMVVIAGRNINRLDVTHLPTEISDHGSDQSEPNGTGTRAGR